MEKKRSWICLVILVCVCFMGTAIAENKVDYDDITDNAGLTGGWVVNTANASAVDLTGDGLKDLLISRYQNLGFNLNDSMLWRMRHIHEFDNFPKYTNDITLWDQDSNPPDVNTTGFLCADFDNDGKMDFFAPNYNGGRLYWNNTSGYLEDITSESSGLGGGSCGAAWGDVNGDSYIDLMILWGTGYDIQRSDFYSGSQALFINVADTSATSGRSFDRVEDWTSAPNVGSCLMADFDGDRDIDIVMVQSKESIPKFDDSRFFENMGDYAHSDPSQWFSDVTDQKFDSDDTSWDHNKCSAAVSDFNNNGILDIVFINSGGYGWLENNGNGVFSEGVVISIGGNTGDIGLMDFDLDGREDFIKGMSDETVYPRVYRNMATDEFNYGFVDYTGQESTDIGPLRNTRGLCLSDLVMNGFTEIFFARPNSGTPKLLHQAKARDNSVKNNWIGISLFSQDGIDNYRCIGATVHVNAGTLHHAKVVGVGMGKASQGEFDLAFGLGSHSASVDVEAFLPSGAHFKVKGLNPNQYHTLEMIEADMDSNSVSLTVEMNMDSGFEDWTFSWKTSSFTDNSLDQVDIEVLSGAGIEYRGGAYGPFYNLTAWSSNEMYKNSEGEWVHTLILDDVVCDAGREIEYSVTSTLGSTTASSSVFTFEAKKFCLTLGQ